MKYHLVVISLVLWLIVANAQADWVDPNDLSSIGIFPQSFFAGYLDVDTNKKFFYVYHPSENNPTKDPVVVWYGSGPGCSALYSMIYSKGPFTLSWNTTKFRFNPSNWNKQANVVFIESPAQTGFSLGPIKSSDYEQAQDNVKALVSFFTKFPHLKDQDLFLAGEGYSGVTVPWLASRIIEWNQATYTPPYERIRLRGLFLGNPCTHPSECYSIDYNKNTYKYLANHYFFTKSQYEEYESQCMSVVQRNCSAIRKQLDNVILTTGINRRNIYHNCLKQDTEGYPNIPCLDQKGILQWLNDPQIRKAIHTNISDSTNWTICNEVIPQAYIKDPRQSYFLYPSLIRANLRIWVYSGVLDSTNPVTGTMKWIEELRQEEGLATLKPWNAWQMGDVNGGDVWVLRGLTVVTVRSAGHMIFSEEPELGYYLFDSFLKNK